MPENKFIPKRPHKKSRAGCQTCKGKRIKCDEGLPSCTYCKLRNIPCSYGQARSLTEKDSSSTTLTVRPKTPSPPQISDVEEEYISSSLIRNPSSSVVSAAGTLSVVDLKLMHHWTTSTFSSIFVHGTPEAERILQQHIPDLAFRHDFLMHGVLGAASLHIQSLLPDPQQLRSRTDVYRAQAFRTFRQALDRLAPDSDSFEAALMMSLLLIFLCSQDYQTGADELTVLHWLTLYGGLRSIIYIKYPPGSKAQDEKALSPLLCRHITDIYITPVIPTILVNMVRMIDYTDPDYKGLESYCRVLDILGELYASLSQNGLCDDLYIRAITFCSYPSDEFITFTREKRPRALVILMYFLSFLKLVPKLWWIEGIAQGDMSIIIRTVDPEWVTYMDVPLRIMQMTDRQEMADLLLK